MGQKKHIILLFNGRFPSEKAASLFAAKSCEAFVQQGWDVTLVVARRRGRSKKTYEEFYGIPTTFKVCFLPTIDFFGVPIITHLAFYIHMLVFTLSISVYALWHISNKQRFIFYSDSLPLLMVPSLFFKTFYELHDFPEHYQSVVKYMLKRLDGILSTNQWKADRLVERFGVSDSLIIVEPNAVDLALFGSMDVETARRKLGVSFVKPLIVYTGHLYSWKGVDTLLLATRILGNHCIVRCVGGTTEDVEKYVQTYPDLKDVFIGFVPHEQSLLWQAAADVLVLPNTAKEDISVWYTSPMKLFEYMASRRPIVASRLPSIESVVGVSGPLFWAEPDNPQSFATEITKVLSADCGAVVARARYIVEEHSWSARARRIIHFFETKFI